MSSLEEIVLPLTSTATPGDTFEICKGGVCRLFRARLVRTTRRGHRVRLRPLVTTDPLPAYFAKQLERHARKEAIRRTCIKFRIVRSTFYLRLGQNRTT